MDNNELLAQVLAAINERTDALEKKLDERIDALETRFNERTDALEKKLDERTAALDQKLEERTDLLMRMIHEQSVVLTEKLTEKMYEVSREAETRVNLKIEHEVSKKIESLFDGYKLAHEKQWELDRENQQLRDRVEAIEVRLAALENKSA